MRLSFVVPAYNEEAYLPACLESVLAQTRELGDAVEIIVVNNASSDRTREVALGYSGVRVVDEPQKGLTFARQAGFAASTGELIANVDSDSRLTPGWVRTVLKKFAAEPRLVALSGPFIYNARRREEGLPAGCGMRCGLGEGRFTTIPAEDFRDLVSKHVGEDGRHAMQHSPLNRLQINCTRGDRFSKSELPKSAVR